MQTMKRTIPWLTAVGIASLVLVGCADQGAVDELRTQMTTTQQIARDAAAQAADAANRAAEAAKRAEEAAAAAERAAAAADRAQRASLRK